MDEIAISTGGFFADAWLTHFFCIPSHPSSFNFRLFFFFPYFSISLFSLWEWLNFQLRDIKLVGLGIIQTNLIQFRIKELKLQVSRWVKVDHLEGLRGWACFHLKIISNWKLFPPEKCFHLKIVSTWKLFPPEKLFTLENHFYVKIVSTWKLFPLENYSNFGSESHIWRVWIWTAPHLSAAKNIWFQPIKTNSSVLFKDLKGTILSVASLHFTAIKI